MKEIRSIEGSEFRIMPESRKVEGYALLFNVESNDLGGFTEVIAPTALNGVIEQSDVLALYNHEENSVLGRSTNGKGTLSLNVDKNGLIYSFSTPNTPTGNEVYDAIQRGDLRNSSFAFTVAKDGQKWEKIGDKILRTITQFDKLFDVSPVYRPAYSDTTVAARSLDLIKKELIDMDEVRQEIKIEVEVKVCDDSEMEQVDPNNPMDPTEDPMMNPTDLPDAEVIETIDVLYDGKVYSIPKDVLEPYLNENNSARKLELYFSEMEKSIDQLKK